MLPFGLPLRLRGVPEEGGVKAISERIESFMPRPRRVVVATCERHSGQGISDPPVLCSSAFWGPRT